MVDASHIFHGYQGKTTIPFGVIAYQWIQVVSTLNYFGLVMREYHRLLNIL